ncbi:MAG: xylulokinase [Thermomicrobiales bacterium]|nr:xylulokinase [Thermomicrobiales bacterium]
MSERGALLAVDAGTSGCRVAAFELVGRLLHEHAVPYRPRLGPGGRAEQPLADVESAMLTGLGAVAGLLGGRQPVALAVDAQLGLVLHNRAGMPLEDALTWQDRRAEAQAARIEVSFGQEHLYGITGRRASGEQIGPQLRWFADHAPECHARIGRAFTLKDHLVWRLTGQVATDVTHASYSLLANVHQNRWQPELLEAARVKPEMLPPIRAATEVAGPLRREIAATTGLPAGLPVAVGSSDGSVGCLGAGLTMPGVAVNVAGSSDVVFVLVDRLVAMPEARLVQNAFLVPGLWAVGGPTGLTGGCLDWFVETFPPPGDPALSAYERTEVAVAAVPGGSDGLRFYPNLTGSRTPDWDAGARGRIDGITPKHGWGHFARAIMEGAAAQVSEIVSIAEAAGARVDEVRLVGGGACSPEWRKIRAATLRRPVRVVEGGSLAGSAMIAGVAAGFFPSLTEAATAFEATRQPTVVTP